MIDRRHGRSRRRLWSEMATVSSSAGPVEGRAQALLERLQGAVSYAAAWLGLRDPETRRHRPVGTQGDVESLVRYFTLPDADDEMAELGLNRDHPPVRATDRPRPLPEIRAWADYLLPAGFRNGAAAALFTEDGRQVGFLGLLTDDPAQPTTDFCDLIGVARPLFARALDRMPSATAVAELTGDVMGGAVLTRAGSAQPLPGCPEHPLLAPGSAVLVAARELAAASGARATFHCPWSGTLVRVTVLDCRDQPPDHVSAVALVRRSADLRGLQAADLRLLGVLLRDRSDDGGRSGADPLRVGGRLHEIAERLRVPSARAALLHAAREGLYVPPALWDESVN